MSPSLHLRIYAEQKKGPIYFYTGPTEDFIYWRFVELCLSTLLFIKR